MMGGILIDLFLAVLVGVSEAQQKPVIVEVQGKKIHYDEVEVKRSKIEEGLRARNGHVADEAEIRRRKLEAEKRVLVRRILQIVRADKYKELGISASNEEVQAEVARLTASIKPKDLQKSDAEVAALVSALREALQNPDKEREIYERAVSKNMPYSAWKYHREKLNTKEKIDSLATVKPSVAVYDPNTYGQEKLAENVMHRKLEERLAKEIKIEDYELESALAAVFGAEARISTIAADQVDIVRSQLIKKKRSERVKAFWEAANENVEINILDKNYEVTPSDLNR